MKTSGELPKNFPLVSLFSGKADLEIYQGDSVTDVFLALSRIVGQGFFRAPLIPFAEISPFLEKLVTTRSVFRTQTNNSQVGFYLRSGCKKLRRGDNYYAMAPYEI